MNDPFAHVLPEVMQFTQLQSTQFILLLGIIMFFGSIGGRLFQKLKIPQVVGYIVIGIIIGSSGFQILGSQTILALNPVNTMALSLIGFLVGAELKIDVIKKYGKQFIGILIGETMIPFITVTILVSLVTFLFTKNIFYALCLGLVLGAICAATAPAATTDVLKEYRTRGPLTTTVLGIVAMDDAVALILYAVASTIASPILEGKEISIGYQLLNIFIDIFGSIAIGSLFGLIIALVVRNIMSEEGKVLCFALGGLFLSTGISEILNLDNILASMSIGFFMVNFAPAKTRGVFKLVNKFTPPVYVLFFVLVGAKLNIWTVAPMFALIAIVYIIGRTLGKSIGSRMGASITKAPVTVKKYLPWCLLSQAGVAIGLSIKASNDFPDTIGPQIILIITATTFIVQLIGPICVKHGVSKAGEVGLDITEDDILSSAFVKDVMWGKESICSKESKAIVGELDTIAKILSQFETHHNQSFVVADKDGKLTGIITLEHIKETLMIGDFAQDMLALDIMDKVEYTCKPQDSLPDVYKKFTDKDVEELAIVDEDGKAMGIAEKFALDHYIHARILELNRKVESLG